MLHILVQIENKALSRKRHVRVKKNRVHLVHPYCHFVATQSPKKQLYSRLNVCLLRLLVKTTSSMLGLVSMCHKKS